MEATLQRRIQRYGWDKAVSDYEPGWKHQLEPAHTRLLALAALQHGERVLDVACGTGLVSFRAAAAVGLAGAVVGTDISAHMVARARALAAQPPPPSHVLCPDGRRGPPAPRRHV